MDPKLFQQRLAELADIQVIREPRHSGDREIEPQQVHRAGELRDIDPKNNSTWNIQAKKIRPVQRQCQDCERTVTDRVVTHSLYTYPQTHWRTACQACQLVRHPETGGFELPSRRSQAAFLTYFKQRNK